MPAPSMEGLILTSTTDTQEQVNEAAGIKPAPAVDEETEQPETAEAVKTSSESETEHPESEKSKGKGGFQKKIDKLTKRLGSTETELEKERRLREELETRLAEKEKPAAAATLPQDDGRPKLANFANPDEWADALLKWDRTQREAESAKASEEAEQRKMFDAYQTRKAESREKHEDWDEVMKEVEGVTIPVAASNAIIESEVGPEIAYYLATHEEVREKLTKMSITSAVREIGRIEGLLLPKEQSSPTPIRSKAPAPITPLGGSTKRTASIDDPNISMEEYREIRLAQRRGR